MLPSITKDTFQRAVPLIHSDSLFVLNLWTFFGPHSKKTKSNIIVRDKLYSFPFPEWSKSEKSVITLMKGLEPRRRRI